MVRHNYVCDVLPSPRNSVENNEYVDESDLSLYRYSLAFNQLQAISQ